MIRNLLKYEIANIKMFDEITLAMVEDYIPTNSQERSKMISIINDQIEFLSKQYKKIFSSSDKAYNNRIKSDIELLKTHIDFLNSYKSFSIK